MSTIIQVKHQNNPDAPWKNITPEQLSKYCVEICGGGYTEDQTADAMLLQREILDLKDGVTWKSPAGVLEVRIVHTQFKVEVTTGRDPKWYGNAKVYDTFDVAEEEAVNLAYRWTSVNEARVVEFYRDHATEAEVEAVVVFPKCEVPE